MEASAGAVAIEIKDASTAVETSDDTAADNQEMVVETRNSREYESSMVKNEAYGISMRQIVVINREDEDHAYEVVV